MDDFPLRYSEQLKKVKSRRTPSTEDLDSLCSLLEAYDKNSTHPKKGEHLKSNALATVIYFNSHPAFRSLESMLRLYIIVGKYSGTLGAHGIFDQCEAKEYFCNSFKFHLLWAESHAKLGHAQKVREILELVRRRLKDVPASKIDSEFRILAEKYLPTHEIVPIDDVMLGFPTGPTRRASKRVSQVALYQEEAQKHKESQPVAPLGNGFLVTKPEFVDKVTYLPFSFEELGMAAWMDDHNVVDMEISVMQKPESTNVVENEYETITKPVQTPASCKSLTSRAVQQVDEPRLPSLAEVSEHEVWSEKRKRILSPPQSTRESRLIQSNTRSNVSPVSFRECEYNKVAAIFADTVNLGPAEPKDETMPVESKPIEAFEVFEDPEPTIAPASKFAVPERRHLAEIKTEKDKPRPDAKRKSFFDLDISGIENNFEFANDLTLAGQRHGYIHNRDKDVGIVTSTPAPHTSYGSTITADDFFSANIENNSGVSLGARSSQKIDQDDECDVLERTGISRPMEMISGDFNPWDNKIREKIMSQTKAPLMQHDYQTNSPKISRNKELILSGMKFMVMDLVGEGGFAKVFKCFDKEADKYVALKYEIPSCAWEVYICHQLQTRLRQIITPSSKRSLKCVMEITDAFIFKNSSILINDFLPYGTLLDLSNKIHGGAQSQLIMYMAIQVATVLRDIHATQIIHGDVKPDNIMITTKIDENWDIDELLTTPTIKFIDWGRAIDMSSLPSGISFQGRAGTANFDCPEMTAGKPWNYQTDYFGFVATMHVFIFGKYCKLVTIGRNTMDQSIKRRMACRDVLGDIFDRLLNIPSCDDLPNWNEIVREMTTFFRREFNVVEWRNIARVFNQNLLQAN